MKDPKYPKNLATLLEVNSDSVGDDRDSEGHIMSVSKSFAGATAALMAADGKFGSKKINATLLDILQEAKSNYPERMDKIVEYEEMVTAKGCGDVTMSELLSHRSGFAQGKNYFEPGKLSNIKIFKSDELFKFDRANKDKIWSYCNPGFVLAEDMMSLVSDSDKGYYEELKNRIIKPLDLKHTKYVYESEEAKSSVADTAVIEGVIYDYGIPSKETKRSNFLTDTQKGSLALSEGGLCSSINDLETFYGELAKTACGIPSRLTPDSEKAKEVHGFYLDTYNAGENCDTLDSVKLYKHCSKHYSLGTVIQVENGFDMEKGVSTPSRDNEDRKVSFWHVGSGPGGASSAIATMPFSFADFTSGAAELKEGEKPELKASISQSDVLAKDSLLTMVSCDYIAKIDEYFSDKCDKETDKSYNAIEDGYNWRQYYQYFEAARTGEDVAQVWQANLITEGRLPKNFGEFHKEIRAAYAPAEEVLQNYVKENFFTNGVIDSKKVSSELQTAEDFEKINKILEPHLQEAREQVQKIFVRADHARMMESDPKVPSGSPKAVEAMDLADEKIIDVKKDSDGKSWVDEVADGKKSSRGNSDEMMM